MGSCSSSKELAWQRQPASCFSCCLQPSRLPPHPPSPPTAEADFVKGSPCGERWTITESDVGKPVSELARRCAVSETCLRSANPAFFADPGNFDNQILGQLLIAHNALGDRLTIGCQQAG